MKKINQIAEHYPDETFVIADGFDDAIIGIDANSKRIIYSISECIKILCNEMEEDEAVEYFYFNTINAYVGENTPIFLESFEFE